MQKLFIAATFTAIIFSNVCLAMKPTDFTLGGVNLNIHYNDVIKTFGEPVSKIGGWAQLVTNVIKYGESIEIGFCGEKVRYVVTTANNGWKTAAGVYVGMPLDEVIKIYGTDFTKSTRTSPLDSNKPYFYHKWTGTKYSWSQVADVYYYAPKDTRYIISVIVDADKVSAIELNQSSPEY